MLIDPLPLIKSTNWPFENSLQPVAYHTDSVDKGDESMVTVRSIPEAIAVFSFKLSKARDSYWRNLFHSFECRRRRVIPLLSAMPMRTSLMELVQIIFA